MSDLVNQLRLRADFVGSKIDTYERPYDSRLDREAAALIEQLEAENERLTEALRWYQKTVGDCRKITPEGHLARSDLHQDCGDRARAALAGKAGT